MIYFVYDILSCEPKVREKTLIKDGFRFCWIFIPEEHDAREEIIIILMHEERDNQTTCFIFPLMISLSWIEIPFRLQSRVSFSLITIIKCFYSWFHERKREREREKAVSPLAVFVRNIQNLVLLVFKILSMFILNGKFPFDIHYLCWPRKNMDDTQS